MRPTTPDWLVCVFQSENHLPQLHALASPCLRPSTCLKTPWYSRVSLAAAGTDLRAVSLRNTASLPAAHSLSKYENNNSPGNDCVEPVNSRSSSSSSPVSESPATKQRNRLEFQNKRQRNNDTDPTQTMMCQDLRVRPHRGYMLGSVHGDCCFLSSAPPRKPFVQSLGSTDTK